MYWYLVFTKPRKESQALANLERQGYECYLPMLKVEKIRQGLLKMNEEPLFPRYLFIRLDSSMEGKSWAPIRSTLGVSQLVKFGTEPARVDEGLVATLRTCEGEMASAGPRSVFQPGERLVVTEGPFSGLEAVYQMGDGNERVMVLIEFMSKKRNLAVPVGALRRA